MLPGSGSSYEDQGAEMPLAFAVPVAFAVSFPAVPGHPLHVVPRRRDAIDAAVFVAMFHA